MKKILSIFMSLAIAFMCFMPYTAFADEKQTTVNRYNVVFVIDASASMKYSDKNNNRFEATDLFLGMLANDGNYVGTVIFNGDINATDITNVSGNGAKKTISKAIRNNKLAADTDIGGALLEATTLLDEKANKNLPSIIILLSDGNTDFDEQKQIDKSKQDKETALEKARDNGYSIYTVSLNSNGKADAKELKNIANATKDGMFEEVNNAKDLKNVFDKYYTKIYGTESSKLVDTTVDKSGKITKKFTVSDVGVEEVNIAVFGEIENCNVIDPSGKIYSDAEMQDITFSAKSFKIIKLVNPQKGDWTVKTKAKPGAKITVVKTYNVNLNVKATVENESKSYKQNSPIKIYAKLFEDKSEVTDLARYNGFKATLTVKDYDSNVVYEQTVDTATQNGFEFEFTPTKLNTYYANITVEGTDVFANANELTFNVGNTAPSVSQDTIKKHINIYPFLIKTNSTIDLTSVAKDNEDKDLQYKVVSSTWNDKDYTLENGQLTINSFKDVSKGSFEVQAIDSQGAYVPFNVKITSTNIGVLAMILIIVAIVLAVAIILLVLNYKRLLTFMGDVTVSSVSDYSSDKVQKNRGQIKLSSFNVNVGGLDRKSYFQASGKNYITYISKKPFYTNMSPKKEKKIQIKSQQDVYIYSDAEQQNGIEVRFDSYNDSSIF